MPPGPGRPPLPADERKPTKLVRMYEDMADKIAWILRLEGNGTSMAAFLEEELRREVDNRYAPLSKRVETIKAAEAGDDEAPVLANDLGDPGA